MACETIFFQLSTGYFELRVQAIAMAFVLFVCLLVLVTRGYEHVPYPNRSGTPFLRLLSSAFEWF